MSKTGGRVASFDGLRGLAALIVMVSHLVQTTPYFWSLFIGSYPVTPLNVLLKLPPLHILWNGPLMVHLFFMLSGVVLVLSFQGKTREMKLFIWIRRRLARLLGPIWIAVLLTLVLSTVLDRGGAWLSDWANSYNQRYTLSTFVQDLVVVRGTSQMNAPLWSLQLEIIFSMVLPFGVLLYSKFPSFLRTFFPALAVLAASISQVPNIEYATMFAIGFWIGSEWSRVSRWWDLASESASFRKTQYVQIALAIVFLDLNSVSSVIPHAVPAFLAVAAQLAGMTYLVIVTAKSPTLSRFFCSTPLQYLGKISFSLYLIHMPILLALVALIRDFWLSLPLAFVVALISATIFERLVERPLHRLARRL